MDLFVVPTIGLNSSDDRCLSAAAIKREKSLVKKGCTMPAVPQGVLAQVVCRLSPRPLRSGRASERAANPARAGLNNGRMPAVPNHGYGIECALP